MSFIRNATPADLSLILGIMNERIINSTAIFEYEPKSEAWITDWYRKKISAGMPVFIFEAEGVPAGFGTYDKFREKKSYQYTVEHTLHFQEQHRSKGYGAKMMNALLARAKEQGFHVMIGVITTENTGSIRFHERFGFETAGIFKEVGFKFNRWLDVAMMQKIL